MVINRITIHNFGAITHCEIDLDPLWNTLHTRYATEIATVIELLSCNRTASTFQADAVRNETRIEAQISLGVDAYLVKLSPADEDSPRLCLSVTDTDGEDVTDRYRYTLTQCLEQDTLAFFDGQDRSYPLRLCWYRRWDECALAKKWDADTRFAVGMQTFRSQLLQYIKTFEPEPIHNSKTYMTAINAQGEFEVVSYDASEQPRLSETEEKLFLYTCYLNVVKFWDNIQKIRNIHYEKKPLLIKHFLEFLDQSADINSLVTRTKRLGRQVILVTLPK